MTKVVEHVQTCPVVGTDRVTTAASVAEPEPPPADHRTILARVSEATPKGGER
ncbi:MAG: hypothetical protein KA354_22920 [Phycisphaerae bacterium]|nr:hypothetical protein [Phycisphaerae bacterium]